MGHLPLAWAWVVAGVWIAAGRPALPAPMVGSALVLSIAGWRWAGRAWPALLQPGRVVRSLCWLGHGLAIGAAVLILGLCTPLLAEASVFGIGLLIAVLLAPLPLLGATAWLWQLVGLFGRPRRCIDPGH